jgi:type III secretion protein U
MVDEVTRLQGEDFRTAGVKAVVLISIDIARALLPILGVAIVVGFASNYFQTGSIFAFEGIKPSLEKISPAAGAKRIFSMKQLIEMLKSILKITILSVLLYYVVRDSIGAFVGSLDCGLSCEAQVTVYAFGRIFVISAVVFILIAAADFMYQRHAYTKSLMMSKEEVKREFKESEGDPHIKGHRKQLAHELLMSDAGHQARSGSAVVVNPTHLAVVLRYEQGVTPLPIVTAKGSNRQAVFLRAEAERAGVPIFRNVALARGLFASTEVDQYVPEDLFEVVAEVLAWVDRHRDELYRGPLDHGVIDMELGDHRQA